MDKIFDKDEFQEIFNNEVALRNLVRRDVEICHKVLYHELSKHAHGNDGMIVIPKADLNSNERAALVSLMKLQNTWRSGPLGWREE